MKLSMKILSIVLVLSMSNTVFASNGEPDFTIKKTGEKTLHLDGKGMVLQNFEITFQDEQGTTLFTEYVTNADTFDRNYNLGELANGKYVLVIEMPGGTKILPIIM